MITEKNIFTLIFKMIITFSLFALTNISKAQEMEPRTYGNVPTGVNVAALTYSYSTGDIVADASSPIQGLELSTNTIGAGYVRTFGLFNKLCRIQAAIPFVFIDGTARLQGRDTAGSRTGFADMRVRLGINLFGSPAYKPKDFAKYKEKIVFGASVVVQVPTGQYFEEKFINIGSNRWGIKPELGVSGRFGPMSGEFYTGFWFFTKNNEYVKTNTLEQQPLFTFQGHISYTFPSRIWIALSGAYVNGGETKVNGVFKNNYQRNFRTGATISVPVNPSFSIKGSYQTGVATRAGGDFSIYTVGLQYSWF